MKENMSMIKSKRFSVSDQMKEPFSCLNSHIREDLHHRLPEEDLDKVDLDSQEAMEFHYFKLHDYNKDNKLDGLELGQSVQLLLL